MKKILIISGADPTRAYSCIQYLFEFLNNEQYDVELWCGAIPSRKKELKKWGPKANSFLFNFWGKVPKVRSIYMKLAGQIQCFKYRNQVIICHDYFHYKSCLTIKKKYPNTRLIHYCTELITKRNPKTQRKQWSYYLKNLNEADYLIDCNKERLQYQKDNLGLNLPSTYVLNTLPEHNIINYRSKNKRKNDVPIIIYSGGIHDNNELDILVNALSGVKYKYILKLFCYGNMEAINNLREDLNNRNINYDLHINKSRNEVLQNLSYADIGIMYYEPGYSINTMYAAPSKFFEYMSLGVPIISSGNISLINLIKQYGLGEYMKNDTPEALAECINKMLSDKNYREKVSSNELAAFSEVFSYECQFKKIQNVINNFIKK